MSDEPTSLMLVLLRRIDGKIDVLRDDVRELRDRVVTMEHQLADTRREIRNLAVTKAWHYASLSGRLDRVSDRVERIERRLDLAEAPA